MPRPRTTAGAPSTRDRVIAAATAEFAARGYDGAKVDRIAARAKVNKAMLYYHFKSKTALYQSILLARFGRVATAVTAVREAGGPPQEQLRRFIEAVASEVVALPDFPPMWLREVADGGRHLGPPIVLELRRVIETLTAILEEGRAAGVFRDANAFVTQIGIVAPLLFFAAATPVQERFRRLIPAEVLHAQRQQVIAHVMSTTMAAVAATSKTSATDGPRRHQS